MSPGAELEPREGFDRDRVGVDLGTSQNARSAPLSSSRAQTRSQRPGRSARVMGLSIAKTSGSGAGATIVLVDQAAYRKSSPRR